jgi:hypothetical protein
VKLARKYCLKICDSLSGAVPTGDHPQSAKIGQFLAVTQDRQDQSAARRIVSV